MSSPDYREFVDTLAAGHQSWLSSHPSPSGNEFYDHYVGDAAHPGGRVRRYERWRSEHGYPRVRPWNGTEALGRVATEKILSLGRVLLWIEDPNAGPPFADPHLAEMSTTAD